METLSVPLKYSYICETCGERSDTLELPCDYDGAEHRNDFIFRSEGYRFASQFAASLSDQINSGDFTAFLKTPSPCKKCRSLQTWQKRYISISALVRGFLYAATLLLGLSLIFGAFFCFDRLATAEPAFPRAIWWTLLSLPLLVLAAVLIERLNRRHNAAKAAHYRSVSQRPQLHSCTFHRLGRCLVNGKDSGLCSWMNPLIFSGCSVFSGAASTLSAESAGGVPIDEARQKVSDSYIATARTLAQTINFSLDSSKEEAIEARLLAGGDEALTAIVDFLRFRCATGEEKEWWHCAKRLVLLIRRFPGVDAAGALHSLIATPSVSAEYRALVKNVAAVELRELERGKGSPGNGGFKRSDSLATSASKRIRQRKRSFRNSGISIKNRAGEASSFVES